MATRQPFDARFHISMEINVIASIVRATIESAHFFDQLTLHKKHKDDALVPEMSLRRVDAYIYWKLFHFSF